MRTVFEKPNSLSERFIENGVMLRASIQGVSPKNQWFSAYIIILILHKKIITKVPRILIVHFQKIFYIFLKATQLYYYYYLLIFLIPL